MKAGRLGLVAVIALGVAACSTSTTASDPSGPVVASTTGAPAIPVSSNARSGTLTVAINATVITMDEAMPTAEAFAYDADGRILAVGARAEVLAAAGPDATVIDAGGNVVLPGFQDAHVHVPEAGINESLCLLEPGSTLDEYADAIAECAEERPDDAWVRAAGASLYDLRDSADSPLDVLDEVVPDRPALILDDLGHAAWTNSLGRQAAGIDPDDADPQGGAYHRDENGAMTGLLLEGAQQSVRNAARPDDDEIYDGLLVALDELARNGITSVSDAGGFWRQGHADAWQRAADEGTLTVRAANSLYLYPDLDTDEQLAELTRRFSNDHDNLLRFDTIKVYIDGILDLGTAALLAPYDDPPDPDFPNGFRYFEPEQLRTYATELHRLGYRINFHVIGDAATRQALDTIEAIDAEPADIAARRHRLTHTYLVDPTDMPRFAELGVIADFQIGPESASASYQDELEPIIGDRARNLIPVTDMLATGAHVSLSSDWDADPLSPFGIIQRAVTRTPEPVGSVSDVLRLLTIDAAYALGHDDTTGSISVGKHADYIIIDRNPLTARIDQIADTTVLLTVVAGNEVHRDKQFPAE